MGRWEPGARERLSGPRSISSSTETAVPQITARAGLTTRTFFRYFADKREVLFAGDDSVPEQVARFMAEAPSSLGPMELITEGLAPAAAKIFEGRDLDYLLRRRAAIDAEPALHERELRKFSLMSEALEQGFRDRGVDDLTAQLAAEIAVTTFRLGVTRWLNQPGEPDLPATILCRSLPTRPQPRPKRVSTSRLAADRLGLLLAGSVKQTLAAMRNLTNTLSSQEKPCRS